MTFHFFKKSLLKAVLTVAAFNIMYFTFNVLFITIFYNFKAYNIKLFAIKKRIR